MITVRTVLILGAGASKPYGFPTAAGLVSNICKMLTDHKSVEYTIVGDFGRSSDVGLFRDALALARPPSVDLWLEQEENRRFEEIGKAAIALCLLKCEKEKLLLEPEHPEKDWYQVLWERLIYGVSFETFQENKLWVVTFNYDQSFERDLFVRMKNHWSGKEDNEYAAKLADSIPIVHVYGSLGSLISPQSGNDPMRYGSVDDLYKKRLNRDLGDIDLVNSASERVREGMNNIQLIPAQNEKPANTESFNKARNWIESAEGLYFLGFGYNRTNMERLGIEALQKPKITMGTTLDLDRCEWDYLRILYTRPMFTRVGRFQVSSGIETFNFDANFPSKQAALFLRKHVNFNRLP